MNSNKTLRVKIDDVFAMNKFLLQKGQRLDSNFKYNNDGTYWAEVNLGSQDLTKDQKKYLDRTASVLEYYVM